MVNTFTLTEEEILGKAKAIAESNIMEAAHEELYDKGIYRDSVSNFDYLLAEEMEAIRKSEDPWHLYTPEGCREEAIYQLREEKALQMAKEAGLDPSTLLWTWTNETKTGDLEYTDQENQDAEQMLKDCYRGSGDIHSVDRLVDEAMAKWIDETDTGNNDPAFAGEVGEEIDQLVDNLTPFEVKTLLKDDKPIVFVEDNIDHYEMLTGLTPMTAGKIIPDGVGFLIPEEMIQAEEDTAIIERLSSEVHDAWWEEKKSQGFHAPLSCPRRSPTNEYTKFECVCEKCHTDMYPYEELPENIKDYDRATVRTVLQAIKKWGLG